MISPTADGFLRPASHELIASHEIVAVQLLSSKKMYEGTINKCEEKDSTLVENIPPNPTVLTKTK